MSVPEHRQILSRLKEVYQALKNSEVAKNKSTHPDDILEFENLLNSALPVSASEALIHQFISEIYRRAKNNSNSDDTFWKLISESRNNSLILWSTNSVAIIRALRCNQIVIRWCSDEQRYVCMSKAEFQSRKLKASAAETTEAVAEAEAIKKVSLPPLDVIITPSGQWSEE
jgi:hypothetical protein